MGSRSGQSSRDLIDRLLVAACATPGLGSALALRAATRGMGSAGLLAAQDNPDVLLALGLYESAANGASGLASATGHAALGRIAEARTILADTGWTPRSDPRLAAAAARFAPEWALDLLPDDAVDARIACLLALDRAEDASDLLAHRSASREGLLLQAAVEAARGRAIPARAAVNALFDHDGHEAPLALSDDPIGLDSFTVEAPPISGDLPLVSVVMAAKDAEETIETSVRSLLAQTWRSLEVLVIDDGSGDGTVNRVARLASEDGRVRPLSNARTSGAYGARNTGIAAARGRFVTFHDADDWAHPRRIQRQVEALDRHDVSVCRYFRIDGRGRILNPRVFPLLRANPIFLMTHREILHRHGGFEEVSTGGDSELFARLVDRLGRWRLNRVDACLVVARWDARSLMGRADIGLSVDGTARRVAYTEDWRRRHVASMSRMDIFSRALGFAGNPQAA